MLTLSVRLNKGLPAGLKSKNPDKYRSLLTKQFDKFCDVIRQECGCELQYISGKCESWYVPDYRVYVEYPDRYGWSAIRSQPTRANLIFLQRCLHSFFSGKLEGVVSLRKVELAYDFIAEGFDHGDYCALALRLGRSIWPIHGTSTYATVIVGQPKKVRFGEVNGGCTVYVQGCPKRSRCKDSDELERNPKAAMRTIIYVKSIISDVWFMRIEAALSKAKALHMGIKLNLNDFTRLLDFQKELPFSRFWEFRNINIEKFAAKLCPKPSLKNVRRFLWANKLRENLNAPVADQTRLMRCAANGKKGLSKQIAKATSKITFADAANEPLPDEVKFSQRMGRGRLPDDSELGVVRLMGIWNKPSKTKKPVRLARGKLPGVAIPDEDKQAVPTHAEPLPDAAKGDDSPPLPICSCQHDTTDLPNDEPAPPLPASECQCACLPEAGIPQNSAELPPRCAQTKIPNMDKGTNNFGSRRPARAFVARHGDPPCRVRPPP